MGARLGLLVFVAAGLLHVQKATGSITGVVRDLTGKALAVGRVTLRLKSGGNSIETRTDEEGIFRFASLAPGTYLLATAESRFPWIRVELDLLAGEQKVLPTIVPHPGGCGFATMEPDSLKLLPVGTQNGRLLGTIRLAKTPAASAQVRLFCENEKLCGTTTADSQGRFEFSALSPSQYRVKVMLDGYYVEDSALLDVEAGWEPAYSFVLFVLEKCRKGNCDPKRRPREHRVCE